MVYLKVIQKIIPMHVSVSDNIGNKRIWKNFWGGLQPP